ncbi:MAG TPA: VOC family protein [Flavobacterium sp.]|jgi:PhnB protein
MVTLHAYLTFNGNCGEAMSFYSDCLGGELHMQYLRDTPCAADMPEWIRDFILQATLTTGNIVLLGSDMANDETLKRGNAISLMLRCKQRNEILQLYAKLSENGQALQPPEVSESGITAALKDKYGIHWMLEYYNN